MVKKCVDKDNDISRVIDSIIDNKVLVQGIIMLLISDYTPTMWFK